MPNSFCTILGEMNREIFLSDSYEKTYESHKETIEENRQFFEYHTNEINRALDKIEQFGPPDETWNSLAPQVQHMQDEDRSEGITEVPSINCIPLVTALACLWIVISYLSHIK
jgi:hypothetical protein